MKRLNQIRKYRLMGILSIVMLLGTVLVAAGASAVDLTDAVLSLGSAVGAGALAFTVPSFVIEKEIDGKTVEVFKGWTKDEMADVVKNGTAEDMAEYFNAKNDAARAELQEAIDKKASKEDIQTMTDDIRQTMNDQMKALNDVLKAHGVAIKKMSKKEKDELKKGQFETVKDGLMKHEDALKKLASAGDEDEAKSISFKVAGTMSISGNVSGGNVPVEQRIAGLDIIPSRRIRLMDLVSRGTATSNVISWVSQANKDGSAGGTAEGDTKNQLDFDLVVDSQTVKKRTAFIKVTDEMVEDIDFMASEINNELLRELMKDIENQVYQGDNTGTNLNGIRTVASAFAAGVFAGTVDNANGVDVLRVAINQISEAEQDEPTAILVRQSTLTQWLLDKVTATDKRYLMALQEIASTRTLDGIPIIATTLVTADDYLIGNFPMATVYDKGDIGIQVGLDGNDFTKNLRTVRAEWRGLNLVKTNKRSAFVKGTFATDAAVLETA